jgi:hypothetical protein
MKHITVILALAVAFQLTPARAAEPMHYRLVENWAHFPPGMTKW